MGGELDVAMTPARKKAEQHRHSEDTGELQLAGRRLVQSGGVVPSQQTK
jgi:hypothetical protein